MQDELIYYVAIRLSAPALSAWYNDLLALYNHDHSEQDLVRVDLYSGSIASYHETMYTLLIDHDDTLYHQEVIEEIHSVGLDPFFIEDVYFSSRGPFVIVQLDYNL